MALPTGTTPVPPVCGFEKNFSKEGVCIQKNMYSLFKTMDYCMDENLFLLPSDTPKTYTFPFKGESSLFVKFFTNSSARSHKGIVDV